MVARSPDTFLFFLYSGLSSLARTAALGCTTGAGCAGGGGGEEGLFINEPILTSS
jgi:hypothetical protein